MYWLITVIRENQAEKPIRYVIDDLSKVEDKSFIAERIDVHFTK